MFSVVYSRGPGLGKHTRSVLVLSRYNCLKFCKKCCNMLQPFFGFHSCTGLSTPCFSLPNQGGKTQGKLFTTCSHSLKEVKCSEKVANAGAKSTYIYYIALHYIALHCTAFHSITLRCITLRCIALHSITLHCVALHCIPLHYITLHYIAFHCIALQCITLH